MDNTLYVGLSRQMTLRRELNIIANNVANADTTGFKVEALLNRVEEGRPASTQGVQGWVRFVLDDGVARNFGQGTLRATANPLDIGIEGQGFFQIQTAAGERYTRDGRFTLNAEGMLVTQAGDPVLSGGGPITLDPSKGPVTIAEDGVISQGNERAGQITVVRFDDLAQLEKVSDNLYRNVSNLQPQPAPDARIRQGMLESSNVNSIVEITNLIEVQRAYDSISRMMDQSADLTRRSIQRLGQIS